MSPTQLSLEKLRADGYTLVAVTEKWNQFARIRQDLFGIFDLLAVWRGVVLGVQTTSGGNLNARVKKLLEHPSTRSWLEHSQDSRKIVVHGWAKRGPRGGRKTWTCREVELVWGFDAAGNECVQTVEKTEV